METAKASSAPSANPDLDLAERHCNGDPEAFEEVYRRYCGMVYNLAYRMSGSGATAEDLSQEIFLRVFRHLERFKGHSSLKTWVYRVALNLCRSRLGRSRLQTRPLREESADGEEGVEVIDPSRDPEELAMAHNLGRHVSRALTGVKPVFREAVVLRDLEGLSYEEIAEILEVRIGTVRSRIARGRERLREILERLEPNRRQERAP